MRVSHTTLKLLAALTWYIGGGVLLYKGAGYLVAAASMGAAWPAIVSGLLGGTIGLHRGRTMFLRACRKNLRRIEALEDPKVWQFFRAGFFLALGAMIAAGAGLAWLAGTGYWGRVIVGGLELIIALGLLTSSVAFWNARRIAATSLAILVLVPGCIPYTAGETAHPANIGQIIGNPPPAHATAGSSRSARTIAGPWSAALAMHAFMLTP